MLLLALAAGSHAQDQHATKKPRQFTALARIRNPELAGVEAFLETDPTAAKHGQTIQIIGHDLWGATRVSFNGIPAKFSVASDTLIWTTVPLGATTGLITITTPAGTFNTPATFHVH